MFSTNKYKGNNKCKILFKLSSFSIQLIHSTAYRIWRITLHLPFMVGLHAHTQPNFLTLHSDFLKFFLCPYSPPMLLLNFTRAATLYPPQLLCSSYNFFLVEGDTWGQSCKQIFHSGFHVLPPSIFKKEASNLNDVLMSKAIFCQVQTGFLIYQTLHMQKILNIFCTHFAILMRNCYKRLPTAIEALVWKMLPKIETQIFISYCCQQ